jgi:hypothetical protein
MKNDAVPGGVKIVKGDFVAHLRRVRRKYIAHSQRVLQFQPDAVIAFLEVCVQLGAYAKYEN